MGIPTTPPPVLPKDPEARKRAVETMRRAAERERLPFDQNSGGGWGIMALLLGLTTGGFGG